TGDVLLTVFQSIPVDGIIIVTSPQELVSMIVTKAVKMAHKMNVPILGIVENMSFFKCPDCDKEHNIFGESSIEAIARKNRIKAVAKLPIDPKLAAACDSGAIEDYEGDWLNGISDVLEGKAVKTFGRNPAIPGRSLVAVASEGKAVSEHFGHCEGFNIFTIEDGAILFSEFVANPGQGHEAVAEFLNDRGVRTVLTGGIGSGAMQALAGNGTEIISGLSGDAREAVESYLKGGLESRGTTCSGH
ncbi:MAG: P-loop NTPase, partial [Clostridiales bacterium]|nr:P-loop NTPase [Clostridiales bacterium]